MPTSAKDFATRNERSLPSLPKHWQSLAHAFVHQAKVQPLAPAITDSLGTSMNYNELFLRSASLANHLSHSLQGSTCVGVLVPPSGPAAVANIALALLGKVAVNLNYSCGEQLLNSCIEQCECSHVITSSALLKRLTLRLAVPTINLEDVQNDVTFLAKASALLEASFLPEMFLTGLFPGLANKTTVNLPGIEQTANGLDQPATIIFTAGSTGNPKGVVLSHRNILSNIHAIRFQGHIESGEKLLSAIPFFHSFGLTMTFWGPLCLGESVIYHYDPLDSRRIGELCETFKATCIVCTPTMMSSYLRRSHGNHFHSIKKCILGGEKLKTQTMLEIEQALHVVPLEGYGLAETSPVVACNVPTEVTLPCGRTVYGARMGTVGLPLPGTQIKIINIDSKAECGVGEQGLILVKGPQVMLGYLNKPAETARVIQDGWFNTGDLGCIDQDGFLTITGRLQQFSKIAGEMVPHLAVEDALSRLSGTTNHDLAVVSVPDPKRGERLVVVHSELKLTPKELIEKLRAENISRLWIPDSHDFIFVDELPILPNGKLNLLAIKQIANKQYCSQPD